MLECKGSQGASLETSGSVAPGQDPHPDSGKDGLGQRALAFFFFSFLLFFLSLFIFSYRYPQCET